MNVTMPSLSSVEMIRTNPAHAGTARLSSILPGSQNTDSIQNEKNMGTFESYLVNAVSSMNIDRIRISYEFFLHTTDIKLLIIHA